MKLFKFMRRPDQLLVVGVVEVDGVARKVKVLAPLLVQDAESWLADLQGQFATEATVASAKGDSAGAETMGELSLVMGSCAAGILKSSGVPAVDARLAVAVRRWPETGWHTWLKTMMRVSSPAREDETPEFVVSERGMLLSDKLHWLKPYCSALPVEEVQSSVVQAAARHAAVC